VDVGTSVCVADACNVPMNTSISKSDTNSITKILLEILQLVLVLKVKVQF